MRRAETIAKIIALGFVTTAAVAVAALIVAMFSTPTVGARTETLFGALTFLTSAQPNGSVHLTVMMTDPLPLLLLFGALTAVFALFAYLLAKHRATPQH